MIDLVQFSALKLLAVSKRNGAEKMSEARVKRAELSIRVRKLLPAVLLAVTFTFNLQASAQAQAQTKATSAATTTFVDKKNGYSIDFPSNWKTKSDPIVSLVATSDAQIKEANPFPNVKIVVRSLPSGETLDSISDRAMMQWSSMWKVESDQHSNKGKTQTRRLVLQQLIPQLNLKTKVLKVFAASGDNYYIISCADKPENFEQSKKMFEAMVDSFKLGTK